MAGAVGGSLEVVTETLSSEGASLVTAASQLSSSLDSMDSTMGTISSSWVDSAGTSFSSKFSSFITKARCLTDAISTLGSFAQDMATEYDGYVTNCTGSL